LVAHHIIVGSGINGLVAASLLVLKGDKVTVLERSDQIGGCLRTDDLIPGFRHDVMAATWVLFMTSPAGAALGPHLARHGFEYCHTPHPTAVIRPDGEGLVLTMDRKTNMAALNAKASGDGDAFAADVDAIAADAPFLFALLGGPVWTWATARLLFGQVRKRGLRGLVTWFGKSLTPARGWLEAGYQGAAAQALFAPWVLHTGLTPESTYSGQMGRVIAFALEAAGAPVVKGGSGAAAQAFRALIEERGGRLQTSAEVSRIIVHNGRATGVRLTDGAEISGDTVLASVAPGQLITLLADAAPQADQAAAKIFRHGRGNFQLNYALDAVPEWLTPGMEQVGLIHLTDGVDAVSKSANEALRGMLPAVPTICVGQPSALDPTRCPPGKAVLWVQIPDAPRVIKGDAAGAIEGRDWDTVREDFADRIEQILARHIKDFARIKLARRAYSPADLESMNINLVGGDPYGGACDMDQFFAWRPFAHSTNGTSAIKGLIHIGASTHPGPGLAGGSGYNAAKALGT
jgi:phytoene dehydrogenase-like protein